MSNHRKLVRVMAAGAMAAGVAVVALVVVPLRWSSHPEQASPESMKIEVDAVTRATPGRLAAPLEITDIFTYEALNFDPSSQPSGRISYQLSKPAWIRIRIVARNDPGLVLGTLVDWSPHDLGKNVAQWDGRDASGNWVDRQRCPTRLVIEGNSAEHAAHDRQDCRDPVVRIVRPQPLAVLRGKAVIRLTDDDDHPIEDQTLRSFVDGVAHGELPGGHGSDWEWDTRSVSNGPHLLTLNVDDRHDHIGSASVRVEVRNPQ